MKTLISKLNTFTFQELADSILENHANAKNARGRPILLLQTQGMCKVFNAVCQIAQVLCNLTHRVEYFESCKMIFHRNIDGNMFIKTDAILMKVRHNML